LSGAPDVDRQDLHHFAGPTVDEPEEILINALEIRLQASVNATGYAQRGSREESSEINDI
jgi:hypothetical protein